VAAANDVQFAVNVAGMAFYRFDGNEQPVGDLLVGEARFLE
jgi:hypothetical protein